MAALGDLDYLLHDFGDFEFDEEEYIRNCFVDKKSSTVSLDKYTKRDNNSKVPRKPVFYTKQIIPPDDIRRSYAKRVESAWNSFEKKGLHDCFHGFGTSDMLTIVAYPKGNPHGPAYREIHGPQATTEYYWAYLMSVPDCLFFVHETKYIIKQNGNISIVCKFTLTGSRLYLIDMMGSDRTAKQHSASSLSYTHKVQENGSLERSPRTNSLRKLSGSSDEHSIGVLSDVLDRDRVVSGDTCSAETSGAAVEQQPDLDQYLDSYNACSQQIVFKDAFTIKNKHDKYRRLNHSTMGEYVDYSQLLDQSGIDAVLAPIGVLNGHPVDAPNSSAGSPRGRKRVQDGAQSVAVSASPKVSKTKKSTNPGTTEETPLHPPAPSTNTANPLLPTFTSSDILVSERGSRFELSAILPTAVRSNISGILRFHVNADKKVYKLELLCAFQENG